MQIYIAWFAVSNFFVPLVVLTYCYGRICHAIWHNLNMKTMERQRSRRDLIKWSMPQGSVL